MKRETVKTVVGVIIIGLIVVATFLYGNAQRQAQIRHDQDVKKQQEAKANSGQVSAAQSAPNKAATPKATPTATPTAPSTPSASQPQPGTNAPANAPAAAQPIAGGTGTTPVTGGSATGLPSTGPGTVGLIGLSSVLVMVLALRRSRKALVAAARGNH